MTRTANRSPDLTSSWIADLSYSPILNPDGSKSGRGILTLTKQGHKEEYEYNVPSWVPGLVRSTGSLGVGFNKYVRGREWAVRVMPTRGAEGEKGVHLSEVIHDLERLSKGTGDLSDLLRESIRRAGGTA